MYLGLLLVKAHCDGYPPTSAAIKLLLNFLPIMLLSSAQKVAYYAQYYAHNYCNYATVCIII